MPIPLKLGVEFTPAEITAMNNAAKLISDTILAKIVLNLSAAERQGLSKAGDNRLIYVAKSISEYGVDFPALNGIGYSLTDASKDLNTYGALNSVLTLITEATDRVTDLQMVASHFMFDFMTDQYANAERYKDKNVPGADTVYNGLKTAFEGQGPQNVTPPTP